ncbi:MAG TPA: mercuric ion transporter MerT [Terriglobia bacterium]|nr:mercuric ion transporter MerT [Terriglobia bacterium]
METLYEPEKKNRGAGPKPRSSRGALIIGGLAAILASTCCLGPLVLVMLGVSGAWIGNLTVLEPYRPFFIGAALVALFLAYRRIFRPPQACKPGEVCALPQVRTAYKVMFWVVSVLVLIALAFPYVMPLFY